MAYGKRIARLLAPAVMLAFTANAAWGQAVMTVGTDPSAQPGATAQVTLDFDTDGTQTSVTADLQYDSTVLAPQVSGAQNTVDGCLASLPPAIGGLFTSCRRTSGAGVNPGNIRIILTSADATSPMPNAPAFGTITFDVDANAAPNTYPLDLTSVDTTPGTAADLTAVDGSVTVDITGVSFYASNPDVGTTIDFGSAVVGTATSPDETITVNNLSTDTDFDIQGAAGNFAVGSGSYSITSPGFAATVAASSSVDVNVNCTPGERGINTGTFTITSNADNITSAAYPTTCTGLAPDVQVSSTSISLNGVVGGTAPTGSINVLNPSGNFTSDANNAVVNTTTDAPEISATADVLADSTISVDEVDSLGYQCSTATAGTFTEEFQIDYDDPISGGTASTATVTVTCQIVDTAPIYNSDPAPGALLSLSAAAGNQSAPAGLDINNANTNPAGDDLTISSATASDPVFSVTVINSSFAPNVGPDGNDDIEVTCTPAGVGTTGGTLTVLTNDPSEPGGGFTYPLSCAGTGDALTTTPDNGGTLNLGAVPPGTTTGEGLISFTNNQIDGDITVNCSVTDTAGVFLVTPASPFDFTIPAGGTESAAFQCTPTDVSSFTADVSCTLPVRGEVAGLNFTVACAGRPLVIPTMSRWGLVVMSLVLLLVAGVAGRRMLA